MNSQVQMQLRGKTSDKEKMIVRGCPWPYLVYSPKKPQTVKDKKND